MLAVVESSCAEEKLLLLLQDRRSCLVQLLLAHKLK